MHIQDFTSIFQLACAYNFVLGAYSSYRTAREQEIREKIDLASVQIKEIAAATDKKQIILDDCNSLNNLHTWHLNKFDISSLPELNAYRRDIAVRFYSGMYRRRFLDLICGILLSVAGLSALIALFYAANAPETAVNPLRCNMFSAIIILVPLIIMVRLIIEKHYIERSAQRPDRKNKEHGRRKIMRSEYTKGEIHNINLHIRRLHRRHVR